jgi:alpha-galactosidase
MRDSTPLVRTELDARDLPGCCLIGSPTNLRYSCGRDSTFSKMINAAQTNSATAIAARLSGELDAENFPSLAAWEQSAPVKFSTDWQGKNPDPSRETEVRIIWTEHTLYLRFRARYRSMTVFGDAETNGRREQLWDRDVAEVFLQTDLSAPRQYKEFEVSPNGFWIDLDIAPGEKHDLKSGLRRRVVINEKHRTWIAGLALPMNCLVHRFDPNAEWRVNFYRVEGPAEPRFYSAWQPTGTPQPNFHVPAAFGRLKFAR